MRKMEGFTLIELMIVLAVIAILTAIALPNYNAYIQRANRSHAKAALLRTAQWMERVATAQGQYPTVLQAGFEHVEGGAYTVCLIGASGLSPSVTLPPPGCPAAQPAATPALPAASTGEFALAAYPNQPGANANDACGTFTVNNTDARGFLPPSGSTMTVTQCWSK